MIPNNKVLLMAVTCLVLFAVVIRLLPHDPNMTPITALAFVAGLYLGKKWVFILPGLALLISDILIGFYDWKIMLSVYVSFLLICILSLLVTKYRSTLASGLSIVGASLLFFLITNTAVWAFSPWYEKTFSGLLYSYELGLPFLRNMLIGDIIYTVALVSLFEVGYLLYRRRNELKNVLFSNVISPVIYNKLN